MQIYLAAPFFSEEQIDRVARIEAALEANPTVTDFYSPRHHQIQLQQCRTTHNHHKYLSLSLPCHFNTTKES